MPTLLSAHNLSGLVKPATRSRRWLQTATAAAASTSTPSLPPMTMARKPKREGDIGSVFASLSGEKETVLPERFLELKRQIIGDAANQAALEHAWMTLTQRLAKATEEISQKQQSCIPEITYDRLVNSPSDSDIQKIKRCGTVVVSNVVGEEQALEWLEDTKAYIAKNPSVRGFPTDDKQVFELYWSKAQLAARGHSRSIDVQRALLRLFSRKADSPLSLLTPLMYADRLRIRHPGDSKFALGPHMDGGSLERWEDPTYRSVYQTILSGQWEKFDAWEIESRAEANQNLYDGAGTCGVFRAFQGWTSLSNTGPGEGTLRVYPLLREMTAYTLMRPFFKEIRPRASLSHEDYLSNDNWEIDTTTSAFPGAPPARGQELNDVTHPHLQLNRTMVSLPRVRPGDQAWWHCDVIHAVESEHGGDGPSAVMYIPSVPLTRINAEYVRDQRTSFQNRVPPPDFPGGIGESSFEGTGVPSDIFGSDARTAMGLEPFAITSDLTPGEKAVREAANSVWGF